MVDDSFHCKEEKDNEYDKHVVAIIYDSFHSNKIVGHVPLYWSELANKFLKSPIYRIRVIVISKGDICLDPEIPVVYLFHGGNQVIERFDKCIVVKVKKKHEVSCEICLIFTKFL